MSNTRALRNTKRPEALGEGLVVCTSCGRAAAYGKLRHELLCQDPTEISLDAPAPANDETVRLNTVDMAALLVEEIDRFDFAQRLRLAAHLLDDVKAGRSDRYRLVQHARHIIKLVDKQLLGIVREAT